MNFDVMGVPINFVCVKIHVKTLKYHLNGPRFGFFEGHIVSSLTGILGLNPCKTRCWIKLGFLTYVGRVAPRVG